MRGSIPAEPGQEVFEVTVLEETTGTKSTFAFTVLTAAVRARRAEERAALERAEQRRREEAREEARREAAREAQREARLQDFERLPIPMQKQSPQPLPSNHWNRRVAADGAG